MKRQGHTVEARRNRGPRSRLVCYDGGGWPTWFPVVEVLVPGLYLEDHGPRLVEGHLGRTLGTSAPSVEIVFGLHIRRGNLDVRHFLWLLILTHYHTWLAREVYLDR